MTANGVDERERSGSAPKFFVIYRYPSSKISPHGANNNEPETYKKRKTTSNSVQANFSVNQQMPKFPPNFPYAGVRWVNSL